MKDPNEEYGNPEFSKCEFCKEIFEECTCFDTDEY